MSNRGHLGTDGVHDIKIPSTAVTAAILQPWHDSTLFARRWRGMAILQATMATSVQRGKGFGRAQWVLLERCCMLFAGACIGFVQPAYLHQASLVTDMMVLCLQTATGQSVGMATIYPIQLSL